MKNSYLYKQNIFLSKKIVELLPTYFLYLTSIFLTLFLISEILLSLNISANPQKELFLVQSVVSPEPIERVLYLSLLILIVPFSILFTYKRLNFFSQGINSYSINNLVAISLITFLFVLMWKYFKLNQIFVILFGRDLSVYSLVLLSPLLFFINQSKINSFRWILLFIAFIYLVSGSVFSYKSISDSPIFIDEFNTVFYSVSQALLGQTCFSDYVPQYGCYSELISPLVSFIFTDHILGFTLLMSAIMFLSYVLAYNVADKLVKDKLVLFSFLSILILTWRSWAFIHFSLSPYFQYWPIRIFFPLLSFYFFYKYYELKKLSYLICLMLIGLVAVYWNVDSGLAVIYAIISTLVLLNFKNSYFSKKYFRNLLGITAITAITFALFINQITFFLNTYFSSHINFFVAGFNMLPLPKKGHLWQIIIFFYLTVLFISIQPRENRELNIEEASIVYLIFLGLGLFIYYQGRSHDFNLIGVIWPAVLVFSIYLDKLLSKGSVDLRAYFVKLVFLLLGMISLIRLIAWIGVPINSAHDNLNAYSIGSSSYIDAKLEFIRNNCPKNDCIIVSRHQGVIYDVLKIKNDIYPKGFGEILTVKEMHEFFDLITKSKRDFFVDDNSDWMLNEFVHKKVLTMPYVKVVSDSGLTYYTLIK